MSGLTEMKKELVAQSESKCCDIIELVNKLEIERVKGLFKKSSETMDYLYGRWSDEHEYEDIKDYSKPLENLFAEFGASNVTMKKRPFGFTCKIGENFYQFAYTSRKYIVKKTGAKNV